MTNQQKPSIASGVSNLERKASPTEFAEQQAKKTSKQTPSANH